MGSGKQGFKCMIFAFDCDGTVTRYPEIFVQLGRSLRLSGHRVCILTGIPLSVFNGARKEKYPHLNDTSWYDDVLTSDLYNGEERLLAQRVVCGEMDNHDLVGIFKRRLCNEMGVSVLFDDDIEHVRALGGVPVFGVAKQ